MDYSVIVPTHNEGQNLIDTVGTLAAAVECCDRHQSGVEIVVVDDQSTDDSIDRLKELDLRLPLRLMQPEKRCGTARARRAGVDASTGEMLINTDAHAYAEVGWMHDFEDAIAEIGPHAMDRTLFSGQVHSLGNYDAFSAGYTFPSPLMKFQDISNRWNRQASYPALSAIAGCHVMSRRLYDAIGGYLPTFMAPWGMDEEIGLRLWMMGGEVQIIPSLHMSVLFRKRFPYDVPLLSVTYNHLVMARLHLDDERVMKVMQTRRDANEPVDDAVAKLLSSNIGRWVQWMRKRRRRKIGDLFEMFGIEW